MAASSLPSQYSSLSKINEEGRDETVKKVERSYERYRELISTLPKEKGWVSDLCLYEGFWYERLAGLEGIMFAQEHFQARPTDVFLISTPKSELRLFRQPPIADVENLSSPRLFAVHIPYMSLPKSILLKRHFCNASKLALKVYLGMDPSGTVCSVIGMLVWNVFKDFSS
ncbi:cytosolic sulfotransferase 12-like [Rhododendron vialii]|uniref:cytosolic sulfotransferase 12-like n=1 Tax=Rhododendron vialii TaxID=182163 RepID=UPI00265F13C1|nr:cytosolic sulfotransferase 12-like [Rhododendron vialii]